MSEIPIAQPVGIPESVITEDMPCMICGYNLRGLRPGGRCPECGSPVNRSVHGNLLRYADANWLQKVLLGIRLMLWSILIGIVVGILGAVASVLRAPMAIVAGLAIIIAGLEVLTALLITVQEPRITLSEDTVTWRKVIRVGASAAFLGQILQQLGTTLAAGRWLAVAGMALGLVSVAAYFGKFVYLRRFAERVPDPKLARSTRIVMWGYGTCMAGAILMGLIALFLMGSIMRTAMLAGPSSATTAPAAGSFVFPTTPGRVPFAVTSGPAVAGPAAGSPSAGTTPGAGAIAGMIGMGLGGCVIGVGSLVFGIWYLVLLVRYRNVFRDSLACAQQYATTVTRPDSPP